MEGTDICFAPVLTMSEAQQHPHMKARGVFTEAAGSVQPGPAPRFSRTPSAARPPVKADLAELTKTRAR
jgi:alpha-methylacyl-CoA racemase